MHIRWAPLWIGLTFASTTGLIASRTANGEGTRESTAGEHAPATKPWIAKASRALRHGKSISPADNIEALAQKSQGEVIDSFMRDPRFGDTVAAFAHYFLTGNSIVFGTQVHPDGSKSTFYPMGDDTRTAVTPSVFAAHAVLHDGDMFAMFDWRFSQILPQRPYGPTDLSRLSPPLPVLPAEDRARRALLLESVLRDIEEALTAGSSSSPFDKAKVCELLTTSAPAPNGSRNFIYKARELLGPFDGTVGALAAACSSQAQAIAAGIGVIEPETFPAFLADLRATTIKIVGLLDERYGYDVYKPTTIGDLIPLDLADLQVPNDPRPAGGIRAAMHFDALFASSPNSSTNFHRKRAAAVLKTYFCDDLVPVNVVTPDQHGAGAHASEPTCQACHYKLDPMAGFFRHWSGEKYSPANMKGNHRIRFADGVRLENQAYEDYLGTWRAPSDAPRAWNIGYIRSSTKESLNSYGDSIEDLLEIIRKAPETRACIVQRMAEFFIDRQQMFDRGYLAMLQGELDEAAAGGRQTTGQAFKSILRRLVTSRTFSEPDPDPKQCYDHADGSTDLDLPCEVAYIVKRNCEACHKGSGANGGLDLSQWILLPEGTRGFRHLDEATGEQINRAASFERLRTAVSTTDPARQMPFGMHMESGERASLFKWLETN